MSGTPSSPAGAAGRAHAIVDRIVSGSAPLTLRQAAARGALPLPRAALTRLYLCLLDDPDATVREAADLSLGSLTPEILAEILADAACDAVVLDHFAATAAKDEGLAEKIAFHPNAGPKALGALAAQGNAAVLELVLTNQERLIATPGLIDRISTNPALRPDQRGRLLDLIDRFVTASGTEDAAGAATDDGEPVSAEEAARLLDVDVGELFAASEIVDGEEFEASSDVIVRSAYKKIITLNTAQKAVLAMKGGREERLILIRDSNKIVSLSVLKNGRITEGEVESISAMRNVADEVLRQVAINREWSKNYAVVANLVRNPRTPPSVSTNFVGRLTNKDLKILAGDRNVPEIIRKMAKRHFDLRTQQQAKSFRKK